MNHRESDDRYISVVIPLFNKVNSVGRAIRSVLDQKYQNFEIIVVDDGSTDGSDSQVKSIDDPRIRYIAQSNRGVSAARNTGVAFAASEYVCFLDADDEWHQEYLTAIIGLISRKPDAVMFCARNDIVGADGSRSLGSLSLALDHSGLVDNFFDNYRRSQSLIHSSSVCVKREALDECGGFPVGENVGEDVVVWLKLAIQGEVMFDARILCTIHHDAENRTVSREEVTVPAFLSYFLLDKVGVAEMKKSDGLRNFLFYYCLIYTAEAVRRGNKSVAKWYACALWQHSKGVALMSCLVARLPRSLISVVKDARQKNATVRYTRTE